MKKVKITTLFLKSNIENVKNKNKVGEVLYVLQNEEKEEECMMNNYEITDIIWNANGLLLAISYGNNKH